MQACRYSRVLRNSAALTTRRGTSVSRSSSLVDLDQAVHEHGPSPSRTRAFKVLQKTMSLLPRTLSTSDGAVGPESALFWNNILERTVTELSSQSDQVPLKATVAVCGFDKWAHSNDLVTALLEDPFTSDPTYSDILRNRWKNAPSCVNIEYGKPTAFAGELSSPSDWLRRFQYPIRLTELPDLTSLSSISDGTDTFLLNSDVLLLLCDPVVTPLSNLAARAKHLLDKPNTILVLTSCSVSDHHQFVSRTLSNMSCQPGHILFVDPRQALGAVTALQTNPTSPPTIDRYQRDTLGSRISTITVAINEVLGSKGLSETSLPDLRQKIALLQVHGSLSASFRSLEATKKDIDRVASCVDDLLSKVQRIGENTRHDIFGKPGEDSKVEKTLSQNMKDINALLRSLSFWKMIYRVDEVGTLVSTAVQGRWCKELENQLILQTGCLEFTKRELSTLAFGLVSAGSLRSPVLENQLQQLKHSPARTLTPRSLTRPIHDRRSQLIEYTTTKLHREAQSAVIGAFSGILSGAGLGWWLALGEHILNLGAGAEMGTAIGSGALLAVSSIRWAVGKWERAKQRWVQDSERIGDGLVRDLQRTVQQTLDSNVTTIASTACKGMQDLVDKRRSEIHQLHEELCDLHAELRTCAKFPVKWTGRGPTSIKQVDME